MVVRLVRKYGMPEHYAVPAILTLDSDSSQEFTIGRYVARVHADARRKGCWVVRVFLPGHSTEVEWWYEVWHAATAIAACQAVEAARERRAAQADVERIDGGEYVWRLRNGSAGIAPTLARAIARLSVVSGDAVVVVYP